MISLLFRLFGDASPLKRAMMGVKTDAKVAGAQAGKAFREGMGMAGAGAFGRNLRGAFGAFSGPGAAFGLAGGFQRLNPAPG